MTDCEQKLELATHAIFARFRYMWNSYLDVVFFFKRRRVAILPCH